ncbi:MAG TPA: ABC transporter ATP-binding protein [Candidatus Saccharimonadales bacterium]|nr:ABC transporter ATP-binding protein [Candidatus Saccharimonadales bacterium]
MIKVSNLTKTFQSGDSTVTAVHDVSFEVPDGQFASIIGKSGSGKSTLLSLLGALDQPTKGSIEIGGHDIASLGEGTLVAYRRKKIGFVFQGYNLIPNLSALENVMLPQSFNRISSHERKARSTELLDQVGISGDKQLRKPGRLSGGEQQRVAIARALANHPELILADEPTGNLDSETGKMIFDLLHSLSRSQNTTIIVVTHDLSIAGKTDESFRLQDGKLVDKK